MTMRPPTNRPHATRTPRQKRKLSFIHVLIVISLLGVAWPLELSYRYLYRDGIYDMIPVTRHAHAIPNNLIFTYSINLLTVWIKMRQIVPQVILFMYDEGVRVVSMPWIKTLQDQVSDKLYHLKANTLRSIDMYKPKAVFFLSDHDCRRLLYNYYGNENGTFLQWHYDRAPGMIRGDICRGLALYKYGGLYMDVDLECIFPAWPIIHINTTFVTTWESGSNDFFQAFVGATPQHPILERYLDLFLQYYRGNITIVNDKKGVVLLRMAYEQVTREHPELMQTIQIWNETVYDPIAFPNVEHTPRQAHWQKGGVLCQFIVTDEQNNVPFWSHVPGSSKFCTAIRRPKVRG